MGLLVERLGGLLGLEAAHGLALREQQCPPA
jgi:hypothetical protein